MGERGGGGSCNCRDVPVKNNPRARSSYTLKPVKSVIIIYTSQNNKPLHHAVGSPMNPHYTEVLLILTWLSSCCSLIIIIIYNLLKPEQNFLMSISFML